jgi:hypothetical protein
VRARNAERLGRSASGGGSEAERYGEIPIRSAADLLAHRAELAQESRELYSRLETGGMECRGVVFLVYSLLETGFVKYRGTVFLLYLFWRRVSLSTGGLCFLGMSEQGGEHAEAQVKQLLLENSHCWRIHTAAGGFILSTINNEEALVF